METWSAFVIYEAGYWEQPSFYVPEDVARAEDAETRIKERLCEHYGRKVITACSIAEDPDCPEDSAQDIGPWEAARKAGV